jgi:hypothetical protein
MNQMLTIGNIDGNLIPIVAIVGGLSIALVAIVFGAIKSIMQAKAHEESRREIAAYVAEGSISPEDGARLIEAGGQVPRSRCGVC